MLVSTLEEQREALERVLSSSTFARNPRLAALLRYLCRRSLEPNCGSIKEYDIATDVFHRSVNFDQTTDAIVRVEMHRLRKKLRELYAAEGANHPVQIVLQSGRYLPEFVWHPERGRRPDVPSGPAEPVLEVSFPAAPPEPKELASRVIGPQKSWGRWWIVAASLLLLGLAGAVTDFYLQKGRSARASTEAPARTVPVAAFPGEGKALRVLCGSSRPAQRDRAGNLWGPDAYFLGGSAVSLPPKPVYRTRDPFLFQSMRVGEFSYKVPLERGVYELRLYFADLDYQPGMEMEGGENVRVFNVFVNGAPVVRNLDILSDAGPATALVRVFKDVSPASDGYLHLALSRQIGTPLLNAIEIVPTVPHRIRPIRISTQDRAFTDRTGATWLPDDFFFSGRTMARFGTVAGPLDSQIFDRERYGHFSYAIPVAAGLYRLTLHFAESYWGPNAQGGGGVGSRIFDVYCNGAALLRDFDMFKEAGSNRQIAKTFSGLQPNAQGSLLLTFVPRRNYANISAIEVVDETN